MKPGMSAQVALAINEQPELLVVPRSAVQFEGGSARVMRYEGEDRRVVAVTVLAADPVYYAIADDGVLKEGDRIRTRWNPE
jgi:multidrug efflux pump subunit AcrA (membrane-fusion protein)